MNILFCQPTLEYTGSEKSLHGITRGIRGKGVDRIVLLAGADGPMREEFAATVDEIHLVDAPKLRRCLSVLPRFLASFWRTWRCVRALRRTHNISVVHINSLMFPQALIAGRLAGVKCVVHVREVESKYPRLVYQLYLLLATSLADRVVCVCDYILRQPGVWARSRLLGKSVVIYNSSPFMTDRIARTITGAVRILCVSGISELKGLGDAVPFARALRTRLSGMDFTFDIVGQVYDPDLQRRMEKAIYDDGLGTRVRLRGEQRDVTPFYEDAHVLVHFAHSDVFPRVLVEAANFSLPAITTDAGGCPESVVDGETGFVVPVGDTEAMAERVVRMCRDGALYERLSAGAYHRYQTAFSPDRMIAAIRATLTELA